MSLKMFGSFFGTWGTDWQISQCEWSPNLFMQNGPTISESFYPFSFFSVSFSSLFKSYAINFHSAKLLWRLHYCVLLITYAYFWLVRTKTHLANQIPVSLSSNTRTYRLHIWEVLSAQGDLEYEMDMVVLNGTSVHTVEVIRVITGYFYSWWVIFFRIHAGKI